MNKYKLTEETTKFDNRTLHRIEALTDFGGVKQGDKGGWVESESNLSQEGDCWVVDDAKVYGPAWVHGDARVYGTAQVYGDANVFGHARVCSGAQVHGDARVYGDARVCGNAVICGNAVVEKMGDCITFQNWWSSGRYFTYTKSNGMWTVGCFHGTGEELVKKAYADDEEKGRCYEKIVNLVNSLCKEQQTLTAK